MFHRVVSISVKRHSKPALKQRTRFGMGEWTAQGPLGSKDAAAKSFAFTESL